MAPWRNRYGRLLDSALIPQRKNQARASWICVRCKQGRCAAGQWRMKHPGGPDIATLEIYH
jgi:hypothetical protein